MKRNCFANKASRFYVNLVVTDSIPLVILILFFFFFSLTYLILYNIQPIFQSRFFEGNDDSSSLSTRLNHNFRTGDPPEAQSQLSVKLLVRPAVTPALFIFIQTILFGDYKKNCHKHRRKHRKVDTRHGQYFTECSIGSTNTLPIIFLVFGINPRVLCRHRTY